MENNTIYTISSCVSTIGISFEIQWINSLIYKTMTFELFNLKTIETSLWANPGLTKNNVIWQVNREIQKQ